MAAFAGQPAQALALRAEDERPRRRRRGLGKRHRTLRVETDELEPLLVELVQRARARLLTTTSEDVLQPARGALGEDAGHVGRMALGRDQGRDTEGGPAVLINAPTLCGSVIWSSTRIVPLSGRSDRSMGSSGRASSTSP